MTRYRVLNGFGVIVTGWLAAGEALIELGRLNREHAARGLMPVFTLSDSIGWVLK